ncbi:3'-5' exoribonuclease [Desulforhopalus singaporensis]|uniref:3'-5' exoribonuclease n=2 Tax=Desulforhopalus singaporensis TaxID=91360 RepID=A0A1H0JV41_9BACT|nr:3'-5' exoribonuclease [Desulforhopalus singaporensis]
MICAVERREETGVNLVCCDMKKEQFVTELQDGDRFDDLFLVKNVKLGETRAGKPYLVLTVMDKSGDISGPVWENAEHLNSLCRVGEPVRVKGSVQLYRDAPQLKIDSVDPCPADSVDIGDFLPASPKCRQEMAQDLQDILRQVANPHLKKLLNYFFNKSHWWPLFQEAPAAKTIHHAYIGGLLEHSLSLARVAGFLADHYPGVDKSLLVAGALLHDIGKLTELERIGGAIEYTSGGRLKGHLVIGCEMVAEAARRIKDFPQELLDQLQHLILSHHGRLEFGSPTVPMTVEAFILSLTDDLDAKMNQIEQLRRKLKSEELSWTEYQRVLERYLYLGGLREQQAPSAPEDDTVPSRRQPSLF